MKKSLISTFIIFLSFSDVWAMSQEELQKLYSYMCLGRRAEYAQCRKSGLSKCQKEKLKSYNGDLQCEYLLGVKIDEQSEKIKDKVFDWASSSDTVRKEFDYCWKNGLLDCSKNMEKRYKYLWCEYALEKKLR